MAKIAILTNLMPTYRLGFYKSLFQNGEHDVILFCQEESKANKMKTVQDDFSKNIQILKYFAPKSEKYLFHYLPYYRLLRDFDIYVVDGNPRHINYALFSTLAKLMQKKVVIWSTYLSRRNNHLDAKLREPGGDCLIILFHIPT